MQYGRGSDCLAPRIQGSYRMRHAVTESTRSVCSRQTFHRYGRSSDSTGTTYLFSYEVSSEKISHAADYRGVNRLDNRDRRLYRPCFNKRPVEIRSQEILFLPTSAGADLSKGV